LNRIKTRADFLRAQRGRRQSASGLGLEVCTSSETPELSRAARFGVTASRKVGGAVSRNRAKRRLRAVATAVLPLSGRAGHDYVLIARVATLSRSFPALLGDLSTAIAAAHHALDRQRNARADRTLPNDG
jgi:ribonuclease P protein component